MGRNDGKLIVAVHQLVSVRHTRCLLNDLSATAAVVVIIDLNDRIGLVLLLVHLVGVGSLVGHDVVGLDGRLLLHRTGRDGAAGRVLHVLGNHVAVVLVHAVVLVAVRVHVHLVKFVVNFGFEELFDHLPAVLGGEFLGQSQKQLILVALRLLGEFAERVLEILHGVVAQLEEKLDDILGVLLLVLCL